MFVPAAIGAAFVVLPLLAIAAKVDWSNFWAPISGSSSKAALWLSLKTAGASTVLCVLGASRWLGAGAQHRAA
ncbi:hypothetical protein [Mycobacterium tilburgii]|uniref:hypothetical protein n=1 Tax=Mycobacterium tilburgii TaxID=44467 RepID=UPI0016423D70